MTKDYWQPKQKQKRASLTFWENVFLIMFIVKASEIIIDHVVTKLEKLAK